jgi:dienelactone hydrolase
MHEAVNLYSGAQYQLAGILSTPEDYRSGEQRPAVILCQGPGGYRVPDIFSKDTLMPYVCERLNAAGYMVLRFNYRGVGLSQGPAYRLIPLEQVEDIGSAISYLAQQDTVDAERIGLWGAATGGANATYAAGTDSRVKCMVSVSGFGDGARWMRDIRRYWEWQELIRNLAADRANRVLTGQSRTVEPGRSSSPAPPP